MLADRDGAALVQGAPAWTDWTRVPWPVPHDPIFDFSSLPAEYGWLDRAAARAAEILHDDLGRPVVGHTDWVFQNVAVQDRRLLAGYDWDSLAWLSEPAVLGWSPAPGPRVRRRPVRTLR